MYNKITNKLWFKYKAGIKHPDETLAYWSLTLHKLIYTRKT